MARRSRPFAPAARAGPALWENLSWPTPPKSRYGNARSSCGSRRANPKDAKRSSGTKRGGKFKAQKSVVTQKKRPTFKSVFGLSLYRIGLVRRAFGVGQAQHAATLRRWDRRQGDLPKVHAGGPVLVLCHPIWVRSFNQLGTLDERECSAGRTLDQAPRTPRFRTGVSAMKPPEPARRRTSGPQVVARRGSADE